GLRFCDSRAGDRFGVRRLVAAFKSADKSAHSKVHPHQKSSGTEPGSRREPNRGQAFDSAILARATDLECGDSSSLSKALTSQRTPKCTPIKNRRGCSVCLS